jgi:hypothetical protein
MQKAPFLNGRTIFYVTLWVIGLTTMGVWLFGLGQHNSVYTNALLSTSILSTAFFINDYPHIVPQFHKHLNINRLIKKTPCFHQGNKGKQCTYDCD